MNTIEKLGLSFVFLILGIGSFFILQGLSVIPYEPISRVMITLFPILLILAGLIVLFR